MIRAAGLAVLVALVLAGAPSSATQPRVVRVPWDGRTHGGATFVPDGGTVWIRSGTLGGSNVWRVDRGTLQPRRTPLPNVYDIVAGEGRLWAVKQVGAGKPHLYYVDIADGYRLDEKRLPAGCGRLGHGHLVYRGRLWFFCDFDHVAVFDPHQPAPVRRVTVEGDLVEAAGSLWRVDLYHVLRCLEGPCRGRGFPVGTTGTWIVDNATAWLVRPSVLPREAVLTLVRFDRRALLEFPIRLPRKFSQLDLQVVGDELWVADSPKLAIARYSINDPEASPRLLAVPGLSGQAEALSPIGVGAGRAWLSVKDRTGFKLFRASLPRLPPPLRRIRATLERELVRTPRRFGAGRLGPPLHLSCEAAKRLYLQARAFHCDVRFRNTGRGFCAAIVRGRLAVDRTHKACRR